MSLTAIEVRFEPGGAGEQQGVVDAWLVEEGQVVEAGDVLAELGVDKVTLELPAPCDAVVRSIICPEGEEVEAGQLLIVLEAPAS